jgi:hypothetical protein
MGMAHRLRSAGIRNPSLCALKSHGCASDRFGSDGGPSSVARKSAAVVESGHFAGGAKMKIFASPDRPQKRVFRRTAPLRGALPSFFGDVLIGGIVP